MRGRLLSARHLSARHLSARRLIGLAAVALLVCIALGLAPLPPQQDLAAAFAAPGGAHPLGTILSLVMAVPLGLLVAGNLTRNRLLNFIARVLLVSSRSVNSLVWALLFVAIFGPGPLAGMLAIAFRSVGFVGKLLGEAIEQSPPGPIEALQAAGASTAAQVWYGYWPQVKPAFWSIVLLRWDINVRESGVLGLVGAGGIGMVLDTALNLFQWPRVAMVLVSVFVVVIAAEVLVTQARKRIL